MNWDNFIMWLAGLILALLIIFTIIALIPEKCDNGKQTLTFCQEKYVYCTKGCFTAYKDVSCDGEYDREIQKEVCK